MLPIWGVSVRILSRPRQSTASVVLMSFRPSRRRTPSCHPDRADRLPFPSSQPSAAPTCPRHPDRGQHRPFPVIPTGAARRAAERRDLPRLCGTDRRRYTGAIPRLQRGLALRALRTSASAAWAPSASSCSRSTGIVAATATTVPSASTVTPHVNEARFLLLGGQAHRGQGPPDGVAQEDRILFGGGGGERVHLKLVVHPRPGDDTADRRRRAQDSQHCPLAGGLAAARLFSGRGSVLGHLRHHPERRGQIQTSGGSRVNEASSAGPSPIIRRSSVIRIRAARSASASGSRR